jgi:DNA-binding response OmpR family regulator
MGDDVNPTLPAPASPGVAVGPSVASVLVVVDDSRWTGTVLPELALEGFRCVRDPEGDVAFDDARVGEFDLGIIDLDLARRSGVAVCAAMRSRTTAPIVATARSNEEATVLAAFAAGADQFAGPDATARQLAARLRSLLRRTPPRMSARPARTGTASVTLHEEHCAVVVHDVLVPLSEQEREVLALLMARPGRVVTRAELFQPRLATGRNDRTLDFVIRRLRQKLELVDGRRRITAIRGVGFRFELDVPVPPGPPDETLPGA